MSSIKKDEPTLDLLTLLAKGLRKNLFHFFLQNNAELYIGYKHYFNIVLLTNENLIILSTCPHFCKDMKRVLFVQKFAFYSSTDLDPVVAEVALHEDVIEADEEAHQHEHLDHLD
jgi:hypothetical protein